MKRIRHIVTSILLLACMGVGATGRAQQITDNAIFYHSIRSPWSNSFNPALFPENAGWYSTLTKTSVQLSLPFSYNDLGLHYDPARDVTVFNVNHLLDYLCENGCRFDHNTDVNIWGIGGKIGERLYVTGSLGTRVYNSFNIPIGLLDILTEGNAGGDHHLDFGAAELFNTQIYGYLSLGAAFKLPIIPLTIGARVNVLDGIVAASIDNLKADLYTTEDIGTMRLTTDYLVHCAGIPKIDFKNLDDIDISFDGITSALMKNMGFTFDIGAKMDGEVVDLSLSIVDLNRGINWTQNPITIVPKNPEASVSFSGIDLSTLLTNGVLDTSFLGNLKDSLMAMIDYTIEETSYHYSLPTKLYVGASVSLGNLLRAGYLFQGQWVNGWFNNHHTGVNHFCCNNTLSAHLNLFNWLELSVANSFTYDGNKTTWLNPGCALTLSPGRRFQLYAAIEYLSAMRLTEVKAAHVMFGINLVNLRD